MAERENIIEIKLNIDNLLEAIIAAEVAIKSLNDEINNLKKSTQADIDKLIKGT